MAGVYESLHRAGYGRSPVGNQLGRYYFQLGPLHGTFGGRLTQVLYVFVGLAPTTYDGDRCGDVVVSPQAEGKSRDQRGDRFSNY